MKVNIEDLTVSEGEPHNEITKVGDAMLDTLTNEGAEEWKAIVLLERDDGGTPHSGIALHGYKHEMDAVMDLLIHAKAIAMSRGVNLEIGTPEEYVRIRDN